MKYIFVAIALLVSATISGSTQTTPALTVTAWFSAASLTGVGGGGDPRLVANSHTDVDFKGYQLAFRNGGGSGFFDVGNGTAEGRATWTQQLAVGTWYHYAGVYDGATVKAYINAVQVASTAFAGGAIAAGTGPDINVARNPTYAADYFNGAVYDVRIYEQALSANQILAIYNATTPPPPPPPTGVACDAGSTYQGSVPAPAAAAGFNTCAMHADWTLPAWSTISSWPIPLHCSGPVTSATWQFYMANPANSNLCSTATMTSDGSTPQVFQLAGGTNECYTTHGLCIFAWPETSGQTDTTTGIVGLPLALYEEATFRIDPASYNSTGGATFPVDWWNVATGDENPSPLPPGCNLEFDNAEPYTTTNGGVSPSFTKGNNNITGPNLVDWCNGANQILTNSQGTGQFFYSYDAGSYHTLSTLITTNGSNKVAVCMWLDGPQNNFSSASLITCATGVPANSAVYQEHDFAPVMSFYEGPGATSTARIWMLNESVFTCANYKNTSVQCPLGTVVDHWPFP